MSVEQGPRVHKHHGWRWWNSCVTCGSETYQEDDDLWVCRNGHVNHEPNQIVIERPTDERE